MGSTLTEINNGARKFCNQAAVRAIESTEMSQSLSSDSEEEEGLNAEQVAMAMVEFKRVARRQSTTKNTAIAVKDLNMTLLATALTGEPVLFDK